MKKTNETLAITNASYSVRVILHPSNKYCKSALERMPATSSAGLDILRKRFCVGRESFEQSPTSACSTAAQRLSFFGCCALHSICRMIDFLCVYPIWWFDTNLIWSTLISLVTELNRGNSMQWKKNEFGFFYLLFGRAQKLTLGNRMPYIFIFIFTENKRLYLEW